jgi:hypothetical protein
MKEPSPFILPVAQLSPEPLSAQQSLPAPAAQDAQSAATSETCKVCGWLLPGVFISQLVTIVFGCALFAVYLTADDVIAATRDTMEATIDYINEKHGGIVPYLQDVRCHHLACWLQGVAGPPPGVARLHGMQLHCVRETCMSLLWAHPVGLCRLVARLRAAATARP